MKRRLLIVLIIMGVVYFSCSKSDDDDTTDLVGNWTKRSDFEGLARADGVSFTINDFAYVGSGYDGKKRLKDFWKYDSETDNWMQVADCPGAARNAAVGFSVDNRGYLGTGYDGDTYLKDFWEYNPTTNQWTQKANFGGSRRYGAVSFSLGSSGYIGTGYDGNYLKDFWKFTSNNDSGTWEQIVSIGGSKRRDATAFVIGNKAYVCTGTNNGSTVNDFWSYNPETQSWTELRKISNVSSDSYDDKYSVIVGSNGTAFANQNKGFIINSTTVWEYDPTTDLWTQKISLEGTQRIDAVGFSIKNRLFITTGKSGSNVFDDLWEFKPDEEYDENN